MKRAKKFKDKKEELDFDLSSCLKHANKILENKGKKKYVEVYVNVLIEELLKIKQVISDISEMDKTDKVATFGKKEVIVVKGKETIVEKIAKDDAKEMGAQ